MRCSHLLRVPFGGRTRTRIIPYRQPERKRGSHRLASIRQHRNSSAKGTCHQRMGPAVSPPPLVQYHMPQNICDRHNSSILLSCRITCILNDSHLSLSSPQSRNVRVLQQLEIPRIIRLLTAQCSCTRLSKGRKRICGSSLLFKFAHLQTDIHYQYHR